MKLKNTSNLLFIDIETEKQLGNFRKLEDFEEGIKELYPKCKIAFTYFWEDKDIPSGAYIEVLSSTVISEKRTFKIVESQM